MVQSSWHSAGAPRASAHHSASPTAEVWHSLSESLHLARGFLARTTRGLHREARARHVDKSQVGWSIHKMVIEWSKWASYRQMVHDLNCTKKLDVWLTVSPDFKHVEVGWNGMRREWGLGWSRNNRIGRSQVPGFVFLFEGSKTLQEGKRLLRLFRQACFGDQIVKKITDPPNIFGIKLSYGRWIIQLYTMMASFNYNCPWLPVLICPMASFPAVL